MRIVVDATAARRPGRGQRPDDNYPGFPGASSGAELADRFVAQARRYGVELLSAVGVTARSSQTAKEAS